MQGDGTAMQHGLTGRRHGIVPGAASSTRRLLIGLGVLLAAASSAAAQQPSQAQANAIRQACRSDYQSHCAGVPTGGSAALSCLQQNATSLSQPCQQALAAVGGNAGGNPGGNAGGNPAQPSAPASGTASQAPAPAYAPGSGPAPPVASAPMARPPMTPREQMAMLRADCGPDYRQFCRGVPFGEGRAIACLRANGPQLSPRCQSMLLAMKQAR